MKKSNKQLIGKKLKNADLNEYVKNLIDNDNHLLKKKIY